MKESTSTPTIQVLYNLRCTSLGQWDKLVLCAYSLRTADSDVTTAAARRLKLKRVGMLRRHLRHLSMRVVL